LLAAEPDLRWSRRASFSISGFLAMLMRLEGSSTRPGNRWRTLAVLVWATVLIAVCTRAFLTPHTKSIYPILSLAARNWLVGADLYGQLAPGLDRFRYSPLVAALLVPFSLLPDGLGAALWRLLNAAVYLGAFAWWIRALLPSSLTVSQRALLFLLIVPLSVGSLNNGQSNALVLGLLLAGVAAVQTERWNLAAGCVALACLFKVYPIALGLLLALLYPRRFAGRLAVALALGAALPLGLQHFDYVAAQYQNWWSHFQSYDRQSLIAELWYRDVRLLLLGLVGRINDLTYFIVQLTAGAGVAVLCLIARRVRWPQEQLLLFLLGLGCSWMTLVGPATESCTYILLAPTLAWALVEAQQAQGWTAAQVLYLISYGLFSACQMAVWFPIGRAVHTLGIQPLAGVLLLMGILVSPWRRPVEAPQTADRLHFAHSL
jgi:Glycosyltransferase family 87